MKAETTLNDLLQLPRTERARYARALLDSLDESEDHDAETAWVKEIERRVLEVQQNKETLSTWDEVRGRIERRLRKH